MQCVSHQENTIVEREVMRHLRAKRFASDTGAMEAFFKTLIEAEGIGAEVNATGVILLLLAHEALVSFGIKHGERASVAFREKLTRDLANLTGADLEHMLTEVNRLAASMAGDILRTQPFQERGRVLKYDFRHDGHPLTREAMTRLHLVRIFESASSAFTQALRNILNLLSPQGTVQIAIAEHWPLILCDLTRETHLALVNELIECTQGRILIVAREITPEVRVRLPVRTALARDPKNAIGLLFGSDLKQVVLIEPRLTGFTVTHPVSALYLKEGMGEKISRAFARELKSPNHPLWARLMAATTLNPTKDTGK